MNQEIRVIPDAVWRVYVVINLIGVIFGILSGAGLISGVGLVVFLTGALAVFVGWAVAKLDVEALAEDPAYKGENQK